MSKTLKKLEKIGRDNWDDIRLLLIVGIPSGLIFIFLAKFIDYSNLF